MRRGRSLCFFLLFFFCLPQSHTICALVRGPFRCRYRTIENPSSRFSSRLDRTTPLTLFIPCIFIKNTSSCSFLPQPIQAVLLRVCRKLRSHLSRTYFVALPQYARRGIFRFTPPTHDHCDRQAYYLVAIIRANKKRVSHNCLKSTPRLPTLNVVLFCTHSVRVRFRPKEFGSRYHITSNCFGTPLPNGCFANNFSSIFGANNSQECSASNN